ncbi:hypothetical protein F4779DRAFT_617969 [Xylariaceae sp. FL0662B]|nr:hypothetical protein F4779DRAFT_617969 [Xylariaceae sp. FL0662B]
MLGLQRVMFSKKGERVPFIIIYGSIFMGITPALWDFGESNEKSKERKSNDDLISLLDNEKELKDYHYNTRALCGRVLTQGLGFDLFSSSGQDSQAWPAELRNVVRAVDANGDGEGTSYVRAWLAKEGYNICKLYVDSLMFSDGGGENNDHHMSTRSNTSARPAPDDEWAPPPVLVQFRHINWQPKEVQNPPIDHANTEGPMTLLPSPKSTRVKQFNIPPNHCFIFGRPSVATVGRHTVLLRTWGSWGCFPSCAIPADGFSIGHVAASNSTCKPTAAPRDGKRGSESGNDQLSTRVGSAGSADPRGTECCNA